MCETHSICQVGWSMDGLVKRFTTIPSLQQFGVYRRLPEKDAVLVEAEMWIDFCYFCCDSIWPVIPPLFSSSLLFIFISCIHIVCAWRPRCESTNFHPRPSYSTVLHYPIPIWLIYPKAVSFLLSPHYSIISSWSKPHSLLRATEHSPVRILLTHSQPLE